MRVKKIRATLCFETGLKSSIIGGNFDSRSTESHPQNLLRHDLVVSQGEFRCTSNSGEVRIIKLYNYLFGYAQLLQFICCYYSLLSKC